MNVSATGNSEMIVAMVNNEDYLIGDYYLTEDDDFEFSNFFGENFCLFLVLPVNVYFG